MQKSGKRVLLCLALCLVFGMFLPAAVRAAQVTEAAEPVQPVITVIKPSSGVYEGGTRVHFDCRNILDGAEVTFDGQPAQIIGACNNGMNVLTPFVGKTGAVDIVVTNPDGTSATFPGAYTYNEVPKKPAPVVTKLSVTRGKTGEEKQTLISGKNFRTGAIVEIGGERATFVSMTTTTIKVRVPSTLPAGTYDVTVTNEDGTSGSLAGAYTYEAVPEKMPPEITELSETSGYEGEEKEIVISGKNFRTGISVRIGETEAEVISMTSTCITIKTPKTLAVGTYDVTVTNEDGTNGNLAGAYTCNAIQRKPAPVITKLSATSGNVGEEKQILITGKNFRTGASAQIGGETATFVSMTTTTIKVKVPSTLPAGTYDVTVINEDGTSGSLAGAYTYTVVPQKPAPIVTKLSVTSGNVGEEKQILITGKNFRTGAIAQVGGETATFMSMTTTTIKVKVPSTLLAGTYDVTVTNEDGTSGKLAGAYTYIYTAEPAKPAPVITKLSATSGNVGEEKQILISGKNFRTGASVQIGGETATFVSMTTTTIKVKVPSTLPVGTYDVTVINEDGTSGSLEGAYTCNAMPAKPAPIITKLSVTNGNAGQAKQVLISGKNFRSGAIVEIGGEKATFVSMTSNTIKIKTPTTLAAGTYDVVVINSDGTSGSLAGAYIYK